MSENKRFEWMLLVIVTNAVVALSICGQNREPNAPPAAAEGATKTRTKLGNELSLRSAQVDLENAKEAYERYDAQYKDAQTLFKKGIMSRKELDEAVSAYARAAQQLKQAEITLEKTKLSFLANATHITIMEAKKYYDSEGRRMLNLVIKNTSNLAQAESALGLTESEPNAPSYWNNPEQIRALLDIENIIVSIVNEASSVGKPYEIIIPLLPYGQEQQVKFMLLMDVAEAGVKLQYLSQNVVEKIYLEKESLQEIPTVVASQFSQEGQLGTAIRYNLTLEMLVTSDTGFSLCVTNLPPQITYSFVDARSQARVTSVRFTEQVSKQELLLELSIPQKFDVEMIDKTINFQAWVVTAKQLEILNKAKREAGAETIPAALLDPIKAGRIDLALVPKGTGRLEILIVNLYQEIKPLEEVSLKADLHNDGTLALFNVVPEVSPPLGWTVELEPKLIQRLLPAEKATVKMRLVPSAEVGVGEFEAQIEARGQSGNEMVDALEKRLRVRIVAEAHIATTVALVGGLVVLIVGIVIFGVKLSRR